MYKLQYATPAWGGFVIAEQHAEINVAFLRAYPDTVCYKFASIKEVIEAADESEFLALVQKVGSSLHQLSFFYQERNNLLWVSGKKDININSPSTK